jgi:hypothetical protein
MQPRAPCLDAAGFWFASSIPRHLSFFTSSSVWPKSSVCRSLHIVAAPLLQCALCFALPCLQNRRRSLEAVRLRDIYLRLELGCFRLTRFFRFQDGWTQCSWRNPNISPIWISPAFRQICAKCFNLRKWRNSLHILFGKHCTGPVQYRVWIRSVVQTGLKGGFLTLDEEMTLNQTFIRPTRLVRGVPGDYTCRKLGNRQLARSIFLNLGLRISQTKFATNTGWTWRIGIWGPAGVRTGRKAIYARWPGVIRPVTRHMTRAHRVVVAGLKEWLR